MLTKDSVRHAISSVVGNISLAAQSVTLLFLTAPRTGVVEKYGDWSEVDEHRRQAIEGPGPAQTELLETYLKPEARVLDIGCAVGRFCFAVRERGHRVVGVDLAEPMVREAAALANDQRTPVPFGVMDAQALAFRDESFDAALMLGSVLSHIPRRRTRLRALREAHRVLTPGGTLLIETQSRASSLRHRAFFAAMTWMRRVLLALGYRPAWEVGDRFGVEVSGAGPGKRVYFHMYAPDELEADLRDAGFEPRPVHTGLYLMRWAATKR
ncbi:MAG: methyltransferase domain-containing protein [Elusimicrobia bacterium]|nr:methyltransferase domain-containing protein [Elusimicrobiota bacterium]